VQSPAAAIVHHPASIDLGPLTLTGFGVAVGLGFVIGQVIGQRESVRRGHDPAPIADVVIAAVIGFIIGAKIYYAFLQGDWHALLSRAGFVFWGGLIGGIAAAWLTLHWKHISFWRIADLAGPGIAAGYAVGRTGCWAVGDDYGTPWPGGWLAVQFPEGSPPSTVATMSRDFGVQFPPGTNPADVVAVYPTQLFEVAMAMVMFAILWRLRDHEHAEGWLFGVYCALAGIERFTVEFFRAKDDRYFGPLSSAQLVALAFLIAGAIIMQLRSRVGPGKPAIYALPSRPAAAAHRT
jgi:phosphatidylglycerol:prolipoprotein diacylglycerol transferase